MESITKKQIVDALLNVSMAHAPHEVFFDFVASAAYSFANLMEYDENRKRTREESYLAIQKKYKPEESAKFGDILGMMILYAEQQDGIQDILGPIYEGLGLSSKQTGQFFTPQHVADLMARLAMDADVETSIKDRGFVKVYEPTCGAGVNLLMAAQALLKRGYNPQQVMFVDAADIDRNCVYMTYLHLTIYGIPAVVRHQDTLALTTWDRWETPEYRLGLWEWRDRRGRWHQEPGHRQYTPACDGAL